MPFLSVIVPVYNQEKYLNECIESILAQTFKDYELILVDDGSNDKSLEICESYVEKHNNIRVISKNNGGATSARKAGLEVAVGKYIGFVDSDDIIAKEMYEKLCMEADRQEADVVICDMCHLDGEQKTIKIEQGIEGGVYEGSQMNGQIYAKMLCTGTFYEFGIAPTMWNKLYRADIVKKNQRLVDDIITIGEDTACSYFCILESNKISYLKGEYLYFYRINSNSICRVWSWNKIDNLYNLLFFLKKRFDEFQLENINTQYYYYCVYMCSNVIIECLNYQRNKYFRTILMLQEKLISIRELMPLYEFNRLVLPKEKRRIIQGVVYGKMQSVVAYKMMLIKSGICNRIWRFAKVMEKHK